MIIAAANTNAKRSALIIGVIFVYIVPLMSIDVILLIIPKKHKLTYQVHLQFPEAEPNMPFLYFYDAERHMRVAR